MSQTALRLPIYVYHFWKISVYNQILDLQVVYPMSVLSCRRVLRATKQKLQARSIIRVIFLFQQEEELALHYT